MDGSARPNTMLARKLRERADAQHPLGHRLTAGDLPSPGTRRWTAIRKATVIYAVRAGLIGMEKACEMYRLSLEEFQSWESLVDKHGLAGLRTTQIQKYRARSSSAAVG